MYRLKFIFGIVISLLFLSILTAKDISYSGWGKTGLRVYDRNILNGYSQETYYEGKFQLEFEYDDKIEAQLDLRGNSIDNSFELREFSVKFKYSDRLRWKVGNIKKPFAYEHTVNREDLISVDRSNVYNRISKLGYGGRSIGIMAYSNYSKKRHDFPYSYYFYVYKDNSLNSGAVARGIYHDGNYSYGLSYMFQSHGGPEDIMTHGIAADFLIEKKRYSSSFEMFFIQDPIEGILREEQNDTAIKKRNVPVYAAGTKLLSSISFKTDAEIITKIEPYLMMSYYMPDIEVTANHVIQADIGANFYFTKKVRLRFSGDLMLTKNENNDDYVTDESLVTIELEAKF